MLLNCLPGSTSARGGRRAAWRGGATVWRPSCPARCTWRGTTPSWPSARRRRQCSRTRWWRRWSSTSRRPAWFPSERPSLVSVFGFYSTVQLLINLTHDLYLHERPSARTSSWPGRRRGCLWPACRPCATTRVTMTRRKRLAGRSLHYLSTGWRNRLITSFCWHQDKSSVTFWTHYSKIHLSIWCQQKLVINLTGHPL